MRGYQNLLILVLYNTIIIIFLTDYLRKWGELFG